MNSSWIILGIMYGIWVMGCIMLSKMLCEEIRMMRGKVLFVRMWLVLGLFGI